MVNDLIHTGADSKSISINQVPTCIRKLIEWNIYQPGGTGLNVDDGKYQKATEYLKQHNVTNLVYDLYHFDMSYNKEILKTCLLSNGAHSATMLNVFRKRRTS